MTNDTQTRPVTHGGKRMTAEQIAAKWLNGVLEELPPAKRLYADLIEPMRQQWSLYGRRHATPRECWPEALLSEMQTRSEDDSGPPLVQLGPGGDFIQRFTGGELTPRITLLVVITVVSAVAAALAVWLTHLT